MNNFKKILDELFKKETITDVSYNGADLYVQDNIKGRYKLNKKLNNQAVENYIKQLVYENNQKFNDEDPILDSELVFVKLKVVHYFNTSK